ncbi:MAG: hypothetical protein FWG47_05695 [Propionibacteriaceae bacterium]|nr:hypothetical protein [Propionibacteriaceae bacterium]
MAPKALRFLVGVTIAVFVLNGCASPPEPDLEPEPYALAAALTQSLRANDRIGFEENFATSTIGHRLSQQWFSNLSQLDGVRFEVMPDSKAFKVTWSVAGSGLPSTHIITPQLVKVEGRTLIMDLLDSENPPIWVYGMISVNNTSAGTMIASERVSEAVANVWLKHMIAAILTVKKFDSSGLIAGWNQRLVVELPRETREYQRLVGMDPSISSAATECENGAVRIVINPAALDLPQPEGEALMLHEAVHFATGSPCHDGGELWASEGLAEWVTAKTYKQTAASNKAIVENYLSLNGIPETLPTAASFAGEKEQVIAAYALSEAVVAAAVKELGEAEALNLISKIAREKLSVDQKTYGDLYKWYAAALKKLSAS